VRFAYADPEILSLMLACASAVLLAVTAALALGAEWAMGWSPFGCARCAGWARLATCASAGRWRGYRLCRLCVLLAAVETNGGVQ